VCGMCERSFHEKQNLLRYTHKRNMHQDQMEIESERDSVYSENNGEDNSKNSDNSSVDDENNSKNGDSSSNKDKNSSENSNCSNNKSMEKYDDEQEIRLKIKSIMKILHNINV